MDKQLRCLEQLNWINDKTTLMKKDTIMEKQYQKIKSQLEGYAHLLLKEWSGEIQSLENNNNQLIRGLENVLFKEIQASEGSHAFLESNFDENILRTLSEVRY